MPLTLSENTLIDRAIEVAVKAHADQFRKGTDLPYITHPLCVGMILARAGCFEEVVAAGILHDVAEDTSLTPEDISREFGQVVASIVKGCSEPNKSSPWEERKRHSIASLKRAPLEVRLVVCADKLHNVRTMTSEHRRVGDALWSRFKRGREGQAWYYHEMVKALRRKSENRICKPLWRQLKKEVEQLFGKQ